MVERLVDVSDSHGTVIHTYPVTLKDGTGDIANYESKALEAAKHGQLVPDGGLEDLSAKMHVSRGGQMAPYGDDIAADSETKVGLEQTVRERAYLLWERDGCAAGHAEEYWHRALDQHLQQRAYRLWQQEGSPDGRADEYWKRVCDFQAY